MQEQVNGSIEQKREFIKELMFFENLVQNKNGILNQYGIQQPRNSGSTWGGGIGTFRDSHHSQK